MFGGKRVLVTGATGSVGSAIVRELVKRGDLDRIIVFSRDEYKQHELRQELHGPVDYVIGDIRSPEALNNALQKVDCCFHAAAMKHVPICEENPFEAVETNIIGTQNLIRAAIANGTQKVLAISTDKAVSPISVLGSTKLIMERLLKAANSSFHVTKFSSIRFGNILNSRGSVLPLWRKQAANGGPITVTDDRATRYFIGVNEASKACIEAIEAMQGGETFVVYCDEPRNIFAMAKEISPYIVTTGLRAGERLHENLFTTNEDFTKVKISDNLWAV